MIKKTQIKKIILAAAAVVAIGFYNRMQYSLAVNSNGYEKDFKSIEVNSVEDVILLASNAKITNKPMVKKQTVVVIDAGHGGYDIGAIGGKKTKEKNVTIPIALKLGSILESKGIKVLYTRKSDNVAWPKNIKADLKARTEISNKANADLFISIHANSSIFRSAKGMETYYAPQNSKARSLAGSIQSQLVKNIKLSNRGIKSDNYYVFKNTKATSVLVELAFITNYQEEGMLNNSSYQNKYASSIAAGILNYLGK